MENDSLYRRMKRVLFGAPRDLFDPKIFHNISLIAFFAWVGLGADGITSSCYGPEEAYLALGQHSVLAIFVAVMTVATILIVSGSYSQIIEAFPSGGGGYIVASKLLGEKAGVVSGSALVIDYILTITMSVAAGTDALFSILPPGVLHLKLGFVTAVIVVLIWMNLRGIKESVAVFTPIFMVFMLSHIPLLLYAMGRHAADLPIVASEVSRDFHTTLGQVGWVGLAALLLRAFSMGGGTFTGIEAVSNSMQTLREPRVHTGKKAMLYMALSLSFLAGGILLCYLLYKVGHVPGKTLNAVLFGKVVGDLWHGTGGNILLAIVLGSETALLFVAAQTGIIDGPQVLSNMALDYYVPRRFAHLSERLVRNYGVVFMGGMALLMLYISGGSVQYLVIMYSINVFLTFSLSQFGMILHWWKDRKTETKWKFGIAMNGVGFLLTGTVLCVTVWFKFAAGGWVTLLITGLFVAGSLAIRRHYRGAQESMRRLDDLLLALPPVTVPAAQEPMVRRQASTAVIMVSGYNGLGMHVFFSVVKQFPGMFRNFVFISAGVVDTSVFKGAAEVENLAHNLREQLEKYVEFVKGHGYYAEARTMVGTDAIESVTHLAEEVVKDFPNICVFAGKLVFKEENLLSRLLHNQTAFMAQKRLVFAGLPMIVMPIRVL
ncbi:APC family permease [Candidatus Deferrimicrobium sp.]|uniref:APC family permease n=1 Tax=Candidatus Deferrimicrobium sp. TaxID=3060586 RepID=UPI0027221634|nr:APC family permease [Candidatus Deferrimicrobium sp.]MDO8737460.1 APC family permease [Candidatus Deferrimicrobium sp.]